MNNWTSRQAGQHLLSFAMATLITAMLALSMLRGLSEHTSPPPLALRIIPATVPDARPTPATPRLLPPALSTPNLVLHPPVLPMPYLVTVAEPEPPRQLLSRSELARTERHPEPAARRAHADSPSFPRTVQVPVAASSSTAPGIATLEGRIRMAVQAALRYPASSRELGEQGRSLVGFEYRDRTVFAVRLLLSSGIARLDRAAIRTVETASYPLPGAAAGRMLTLAVWVTFRIDTSSD